MVESLLSFSNLPEDFQEVIRLAEDHHDIAVAPLQELGGGRSGAAVYLVRVTRAGSAEPEHLILKLDRKHPKSSSDEISRHLAVENDSPPQFAQSHIPTLALDRVEAAGALAIFYSIAGQSLRRFRTLSSFSRKNRLERLFSVTNTILLDAWNPSPKFETVAHPGQLLDQWLGFRLNPGQNIEGFLQDVCRLPLGSSGFLVQGLLLPNPLHYAREPNAWGQVRALDICNGRLHRDLNTNNILAKFNGESEDLEAYFLIDFALYKPALPLFYDQRYLEMSFLIDSLSTRPFESVIDLINRSSEERNLPGDVSPIEMAGLDDVIHAGQEAFRGWVDATHPSLQDDLWGQYWLAGTAAGLGYCHKDGIGDRMRLAGLIFAAANLKRFLTYFDLPSPTKAEQLYVKGQFERAAGSPFQESREPQNNLPSPWTRFIGREVDLEQVTSQLLQPETRLVSLTGPGGTGKTRLALEAARGLLDEFPHGVYFIDLSKINDPSLVVPTTAHTIGVREGSSASPMEKLTAYLSHRKMLLVFDNFEQVADAAQAVSALLEAAPQLKALATSRTPLQLQGEIELPIQPLEIPPAEIQDLEDIREYDSLVLFEQGAKAVNPRFQVSAENKAAVAEICRRLDGLPLAIELAAARVKMLPPAALLERLDQGLEILVSPDRDRPDRQQTLRKAIAWSYRLLGPEEQTLLAQLSVFNGGFTLAAAEAICRSMSSSQVFSGIETLLNNSLLYQTSSETSEPRFDMLRTIRAFAREKASEDGHEDELRRAHCQYFIQLADHDLEGGIYGEESVLWMRVYEQEHDNIRQAISYALDHPELILPMVSMMTSQLAWFWYRYGYLQEGSAWMERVLEVTEGMGDSPERAFALTGRGTLALWSGDLNVAVRRTREAMDMAQRLKLAPIIAINKMTHGIVLINQGRDREAHHHLVDAVEMYDDLGIKGLKGTALVHLANVSLGLGDTGQARAWLDQARPFLYESGDVWFMAFALSNYGEVARAEGDYLKAEEYYQRTEALYQQADSKGDQARLITVRGYLAQHRGEFQTARTFFLRSLDEFRKLGNQRGMAEALAGLAGLAAELGEGKWAGKLLGAAESTLNGIDGEWWPADRVEIDRAKALLEADPAVEFSSLWKEGEFMTLTEAIDFAAAGWEGQ